VHAQYYKQLAIHLEGLLTLVNLRVNPHMLIRLLYSNYKLF